MSVARYFQDELDTLRVFGEIFSRYHPKLAAYLSERGTDPDVERLLEGFALLTARLREKIDDQLPEVTQSLLIRWAHAPTLNAREHDGCCHHRHMHGHAPLCTAPVRRPHGP